MSTIGVDIGATKTNFALISGTKILQKKGFSNPQKSKYLLQSIEITLEKMIANLPQDKVRGIGLGVPGPLNEKRTLVLNPPNLDGFENYPLAARIQKRLRIKTVMENDAKCFTLAEAVMGAGKKAKIVLGITLGSGVGGGLVINGKIYKGAFGSAGEVGHMTINNDGPRCSCGGLGCLEEYASGKFFARKGVSSFNLQNRAAAGDKKAINIYKEYGRYLGVGISNCVNLLDPDIVVLGGGISMAYPLFIETAQKEISRRVISPSAQRYVKIKQAKFGVWSGAVGAALLVHPSGLN